jgi:hypothetical protein
MGGPVARQPDDQATVAGAAALYLESHPDATPAELEKAIVTWQMNSTMYRAFFA